MRIEVSSLPSSSVSLTNLPLSPRVRKRQFAQPDARRNKALDRGASGELRDWPRLLLCAAQY
eukprot:2892006-Rhodomonas_salina.3